MFVHTGYLCLDVCVCSCHCSDSSVSRVAWGSERLFFPRMFVYPGEGLLPVFIDMGFVRMVVGTGNASPFEAHVSVVYLSAGRNGLSVCVRTSVCVSVCVCVCASVCV